VVDLLDFSKAKTVSLDTRPSKVSLSESATPWVRGGTLQAFLSGLPGILGARDLREVIRAIVDAHLTGRVVLMGMGAHPIKVGLNPVVIDLMRRGIINGLAMNGAGIIHDFELALVGHTSEDVDSEILTGTFGMAEETGRMLNEAISEGHVRGLGIGASVGQFMATHDFPHRAISLLVAAVEAHIPVTVHVAVGTDIIHMHPMVDGAAIGAGSLRDFQTLTSLVARMNGGVYLNLGSAVILPEVFLKAVTLARNLGHPLNDITTVNMDFIQHYRSRVNVVSRPTKPDGRGYALTGHHEIMFPLLAAALIETIGAK
tara:strand:- start:4102 stop:5046 length:945 start_codon:yes stop_codon:yes gene_type:complete